MRTQITKSLNEKKQSKNRKKESILFLEIKGKNKIE
jgi:hypothetical protein